MPQARLILTIVAVFLANSSIAAEPPAWRNSVTSERARAIAGELFPERCGSGGLSCGITYDDRRKCMFEFVVVFPKGGKGEPPVAIVRLDKGGGVVSIVSAKKGHCGTAHT